MYLKSDHIFYGGSKQSLIPDQWSEKISIYLDV